MSCWMVSEKRTAQLAGYIAAVLNMGFDYFGYEAPENLRKELFDCRDRYGFMIEEKIFEKLYNLNLESVSGRYKDVEPKEAPEMPETVDIYHRREGGKIKGADGWHEYIDKSHYEVLKLLACFIYQCDEDATYKNSLKLALEELENTLTKHIVWNQPDMIRATWG